MSSRKLSDFNLDGVKFERLSEERQEEWNKRLKGLFDDLEKTWPEYCERMQRIKAQNYKLSLTRVIG